MALTSEEKVAVGGVLLVGLYVHLRSRDEEEGLGDAYGGLLSDSRERQAKRKRKRIKKLQKKYRKCRAEKGADHGSCKRLQKRIVKLKGRVKKQEDKVAKTLAKEEAKAAGTEFEPSTFSQVVDTVTSAGPGNEEGYLTGDGGWLDYTPDPDDQNEGPEIGMGLIVVSGVAILGLTGLAGYFLLKKKKPKAKAITKKAEPVMSTGPALVPLEEDMVF